MYICIYVYSLSRRSFLVRATSPVTSAAPDKRLSRDIDRDDWRGRYDDTAAADARNENFNENDRYSIELYFQYSSILS